MKVSKPRRGAAWIIAESKRPPHYIRFFECMQTTPAPAIRQALTVLECSLEQPAENTVRAKGTNGLPFPPESLNIYSAARVKIAPSVLRWGIERFCKGFPFQSGANWVRYSAPEIEDLYFFEDSVPQDFVFIVLTDKDVKNIKSAVPFFYYDIQAAIREPKPYNSAIPAILERCSLIDGYEEPDSAAATAPAAPAKYPFKVIGETLQHPDGKPPRPMEPETLDRFFNVVFPYISEIGPREAPPERWKPAADSGRPHPGRYENTLIEYGGNRYRTFYNTAKKRYGIRLETAPDGINGRPRFFYFYG